MKIYLLIGAIYSFITLIQNIKDNRGVADNLSLGRYNDLSVVIKILSYMLDLFIWPYGMLSDLFNFIRKES